MYRLCTCTYIFRCQTNAAVCVERRDRLQQNLDRHQVFARYLKQVLGSSDDFLEIRDIISRYETLYQTYEVINLQTEPQAITEEGWFVMDPH